MTRESVVRMHSLRVGIVGTLLMLLAAMLGQPALASTSDPIARAQNWVDAGVGYSGTNWYTDENGTYRTDCSGFVSMALGLGSSYTTDTLPQVSFPIPKDDLRPGDMLLNPAPGTAGHVVLFAAWADDAHTRYYGYESSPSGSGAHFSALPYPYWPGYGTYTPYRYVGSTSAVNIPDAPATPQPPANGDFVRYGGDIYRIAGGAPLLVSAWKHVGGKQSARTVTRAQFKALADTPADGTFLRTAAGQVYRVAGGAPVAITGSWWKKAAKVVLVDAAAIERAEDGGPLNHLRQTPEDGTWLASRTGDVYRVAGGAPVYAPDQWWKSLRPRPEPIVVSQEAIDRAGQDGPWSHLQAKPADGTFVKTPPAPDGRGEVYVMAGGAPIHADESWWKARTPKALVTTIAQEAIDQAGGLGAWSHVRDFPADGTLLKADAAVYQTDGGVPHALSGVRGVDIDPAAISNAGQPGPWSHLRAPMP